MENEELSSASVGGAGVTTEQQVAEPTSQDASQSQTTEPSQVESGESQASSKNQQPRQNYDWAAQRTLEKTIKRVLSSQLDERFARIEQRLSAPTKPDAVQSNSEEIDFNDLPGSIKRLGAQTVQAQLQEWMKNQLPQMKQEIMGEFATKTTRQEARNYLISQKDIGNDPAKHSEIQDIIANDKLLYHSVSEYPKEVMEEAIKRWRSSKGNPNAPSKGELGTITGGMGAGQRKSNEPSVQKIKELQQRVVQSNLSNEEKGKLYAEIDSMMSLK